jgi:hypothetical protein
VLIVESEPTGARVTLSNGLTGTTPATFTLRRKGEYVVTIAKDGYETVTVNVTHKIVGAGSAGMAGNILLGGIIGAAVDASSGAMYDLVPNPVKVNLVVASAQAPSSPPPVASVIATPPPKRALTPADTKAAVATLEGMHALSQALLRYVRANGQLPEGRTITEIYPALARSQPVRIADGWGNPFAYGRTAEGYVIASAGADGMFDDSTWMESGDQDDLNADAVLRVEKETETFARRWIVD